MKSQNAFLVIRQLDKKLNFLRSLQEITPPANGWINLIRKTLKISLRQLGHKMSMTPQSARDIEVREREGSITLKALNEVAEALDMKLVYGFIPKDSSLEKMIERKARNLATSIVTRTSTTMKLEDQGNSEERLKQAIAELTEEIKRDIPKNLWD
ncbi:MAG TPA: mobile mystery protein A [Puia sp.]